MPTVHAGLNLSNRWDLQIAHVISEMEPNWILHIGGKNSILPLYCAYLLDHQMVKPSAVISIVDRFTEKSKKENIYCIEGHPSDPALLGEIKKCLQPQDKVAVVLEYRSDLNPLTLIQSYAPLVTENGYLVLDERLGDFASDQIEFEPDWKMLQSYLYVRIPQRPYEAVSIFDSKPYREESLTAALSLAPEERRQK